MCASSVHTFFGPKRQIRIAMIQIDKKLIQELFDKAVVSDRKRMNYDLRTSSNDGSQRILNALLPGTIVPYIDIRTATRMSFYYVVNWLKYYMMQRGMKLSAST